MSSSVSGHTLDAVGSNYCKGDGRSQCFECIDLFSCANMLHAFREKGGVQAEVKHIKLARL